MVDMTINDVGVSNLVLVNYKHEQSWSLVGGGKDMWPCEFGNENVV